MTLIELLAALIISAFIVAMASRVFLSGNRQFLDRILSSHRLENLHRMKAAVQGLLKREVEACAGKKITLRMEAGGVDGADGMGASGQDAEAMLKAHFPELAGAEFTCLEPAADSSSLVEWKDWFQPRLIEYRIILEGHGKRDTLTGSWIK